MATQSIKVADIFAQFGFKIDKTSMQSVNNAIQSGGANMGTYTNKIKRNRSAMQGLVNTMRDYKGILIAVGGLQLGQSLVRATRDAQSMDNALLAASGSQEAYATNNEFLQGTVDRLGLSLRETANDYTLMTASADGLFDANNKIANQKEIDKVFLSVAEASTVLGLSADKTHGTLLALTQIMSKGKVQSEELRGQLGERLPGAYRIAAEAMGLTTAELNKQLELGNISSKEFLPKFADRLRETFTNADVIRGSRSLNANINRLNTTFFRAGKELGEGGFNKGLTLLLINISKLLDRLTPVFYALGRGLEFLMVPFRVLFRMLEGVAAVFEWSTTAGLGLVMAIGGIVTAVIGAGPVLAGLGAILALLTSPITIAIGLFTAIGLAVDEMWTYFQGGETILGEFEWFRDLMDMFKEIPQLIEDAKKAVDDFFSLKTVDKVNDALLDAGDLLQEKADEYLGDATDVISVMWSGLKSDMSDMFGTPSQVVTSKDSTVRPIDRVSATTSSNKTNIDSSTTIDKVEINLKSDLDKDVIQSEVTKGINSYTQNKTTLKMKPTEG